MDLRTAVDGFDDLSGFLSESSDDESSLGSLLSKVLRLLVVFVDVLVGLIAD